MYFRKLYIVLTIIIHTMLSTTIFAQEKQKEATVNQAVLDLNVPSSPAFDALDLSPNTVTRPSTPRDLSMALLNGVDRRGNLQSGVAIDIAPFPLFFGDEVTLEDYNKKKFMPQIWRSQFSIATSKGSDPEDKAMRVSIGLHLTPWDKGDQRLDQDFISCVKQAVSSVNLENIKDALREKIKEKDKLQAQRKDTTDIKKEIDKIREEMDNLLNQELQTPYKKCKTDQEFESNYWNASSWSIGLAPFWTSEDGDLENLGDTGVSIWTSLAFGFDGFPDFFRRHAQLIVHGRYMVNQLVPDNTISGSYIDQDTMIFGGRLRMGKNRFNVNLECAWIREDPDGYATDDSTRYSVGADVRLASNLWLSFSVGSESGNEEGDEGFVIGNFKYAIGEKPTIKIGK